MRGVTEFIKTHNASLKRDVMDENFLSYHLKQISFLQHERLVHLIVMLFVIFTVLLFFSLFLLLSNILFLVLFFILLILTMFYVFHYFRLENTVIKWYFIYNEHAREKK
jgi:hypothetical protein